VVKTFIKENIMYPIIDYEITLQDVLHLYYHKHNPTSCFSDYLFTLIAKADPMNLHRIAKGFPEYVAVYVAWASAESEEAFFKQWGLDVYELSND
jgi:hypothetical protein